LDLSVFILCHNRFKLAKAAIYSALCQEFSGFRLFISDSSDDNALEGFCKGLSEELIYRRRPSSLTFLQHIRTCINECDTEYICLFHDDDLMYPGFTSAMAKLVNEQPGFSAFAFNAMIQQSNRPSKPCFLWPKQHRRIKNSAELSRIYFSNAQLGFPPFPAYVYRKIHLEQCLPREEMGKYLDVFILLKLADLDGLLWGRRPEMLYRIHGENDGLNENTRDRFRLISKIRSFSGGGSQHSLTGLRQLTYKNWINATDSSLNSARKAKGARLLSALRCRSKLSWRYWENKIFKIYVYWKENGGSH
jgi:hypothetical protein